VIGANICDAARTPFGRFGGALAHIRANDPAAIPIKALLARHPFLTTIAWRFVNPLMRAAFGVDSTSETGESVAADFAVRRTPRRHVAFELRRTGGSYGLATMCVGVGQGVAMALARE